MLLEAEGFDIQLDALKRLRVWLGIMEQVRYFSIGCR